MKTFAKIIGYGLVILLVAAAIGLTYKYTNGFNEDFKTFYIEHNGKQILTTESKMTFEPDTIQRFDVKYTFDKADAEPKDFNVKIVTNLTRDFDFTVDDEKYLFSKVGDITAVFETVKGDTYFELYLPQSSSFAEVLKKAYNGKTVSVPSNAEANNPYPFKLQISSYNDKVTYNVYFAFGDSSGKTEQTDGDKVSNPTTPTAPTESVYKIEYILAGDATNLSDLSLTGATQARAGETVNFTVAISDGHYSVSEMRISVMNSTEIVIIAENNGSYSFTMPQGNVFVWIYFEYNSPDETVTYRIGYDSLGWADMSVVNLQCPDRAAAGEAVTFTATVKPEFASEYKLSGIDIHYGSGETYKEDLQGNNGTYTFTMPDTATMEDEINEGYITLMFYIVPVDM